MSNVGRIEHGELAKNMGNWLISGKVCHVVLQSLVLWFTSHPKGSV
jgi:hypothetical protein